MEARKSAKRANRPSVAAQASETPAVADRARRLVELGVGPRVRFQKFGRMVGGPQFGPGAMALLPAERQLDLVMPNQAIGHLGHVRAAHRFRRFDTAVARQAWVRST